METKARASMLAEGEQKHLLLLQEATGLLKRLDFITEEELTALLDRRQNLVEWIDCFDRRLADVESFQSSEHAELAAFRVFQRETIKKVLEIDGLVTALAKDRQSTIKASLSSFAKCKQVRNAFEDSGATRHNRLDGVL